MKVINKQEACSRILLIFLALTCYACWDMQGQDSQTIDFRNYDISGLNSSSDWIRTVFELPSNRMQGGPEGIRLHVDISESAAYDRNYRSELRETNINTYPATNTSQVYRMQFTVNELPDLYAPLLIFQRFNRNNDGPDIAVELTGINQFSNAVPNDIQVVAFGSRQRIGKLLKEKNDLMVIIYNNRNGKYKVSLNGETLSEHRGVNTLPSTNGTWSQFGLYPHGFRNESYRSDQINSGNTDFTFTYQSFTKTSYNYEVNLDDFNTVNPNTGDPGPGPDPTPPDTCSGENPRDWDFGDLGNPGISGEVCEDNGSFDLRAAGTDIWNEADQGYYMYQTVSGNIEMQARILNVGNSDPWAKGGIMIRESLDPNAKNVMMAITHQRRWSLQRRSQTGSPTESTIGEVNAIQFPIMVKLTRVGNWFYGHYSEDGSNWLLADSIEIDMPEQIYLGFAASSHDASSLNAFTFDQTAWRIPDSGGGGNGGACNIPSGWSAEDLGSVGLAGEACVQGEELHISASGSDIWNNEDQFFYLYQPLLGNWEISTRILEVGSTDPWAKVGLMIREDLTSTSKNVYLASVSHGRWSLQRRTENGAATESTLDETLAFTYPHWLKLKRNGHTFEGYYSVDSLNWQLITTIQVDMPEEILLGVAATSHDNLQLNLSKLDQLDFSSLNGGPGTFPVEFTDFYAVPRAEENEIDLIWEVGREQGNDLFSIEKSTDGILYQSIGQVNSLGDTESRRSYSFVDQDPLEGFNYYRIKQTDLDGAFSYSQEIELSFSPNPTNKISVFPSPISVGESLFVRIKWQEKDLPILSFKDMLGRTIQSRQLNDTDIQQLQPIDTQQLSPGLYYISLSSPSSDQVLSQKVFLYK